ncbi:CRISPR-associated protein Cmr1 [Candidatus Hakubella thermalkaliphila]|uniref:CRISPR-associated protein Cmr1 n=1 Tax=Candidatus Hakubella thermalkaliphila TaxID=2754717 RepID=A0A6V8PDW3_9ACTN|nr:type III-B CRISPR module RAMP protein Cmr1 [Candidatus Hakubella thermalkaliphila]GFP23428.1 CRISPR-associated protein Cmr1 [Candidatus Hakubella thermalkaliphila]GFP30508.1 CRISPR-associated protein Cmr1 [Candidatus Hakubella thermalkaliphila]GFP39377.1 CRISPR-associated protein Cmr1 [Candidatus Hakubella thermalkaliphila]
MVEVPVTLKFVTPAFIAGQDNRNSSEFRVPSLKGLLRFWWRAFQPFPTTEGLFETESEIFGNTQKRCSFSIQLDQPLQSLAWRSRGHAFSVGRNGIKYLFFSMYQMGRGSPGRASWIEPGRTVSLRFRFFRDQALHEIVTALWSLENFGGIGARSRRGAGSFQITKITLPQGLTGLPQFMCQGWAPRTGNLRGEIQDFLNQGISLIAPAATGIPNYSAYRRGVSALKVLVNQTYTGWEEAADDIGQRLARFRKSDLVRSGAPFHNEARALHTFATSGTYPPSGPNPITKAGFGLPIIYRFRDRSPGARGLIPESVTASGAETERRGSALFIKIGRLPNSNQHYVAVLFLWSQFLPGGEMIRLRQTGGKGVSTHDVQQPNRTVVDNFLRTL